MMLHRKYQPQTWDEFVGQDKAVTRLRRIIDRPQFDGDSFWIVGPSGTGKTTAAWIIARQFAKVDIDIVELDGESCTVDAVRQVDRQMMFYAMGGGFRVWIVNEAQAMTAKAVQAWLTTLDRLPARVIVIFTTTAESADLFGEYDGPFRSRCKTVAFTNQGLAQRFAERARKIARAEGMDGKPIASYVRLVQSEKNNLRAVLNRIESGEMMDEPQ